MEVPKTIGINPGDGECFPWLSNIAPNFEYYTFHSLRFKYVSSVSSFVQGAIALTPEFDPHNNKLGPPLTLAEMLNKEGAVKGNVWTNSVMTIPQSNLKQKKLVRPEHVVTHSAEHLRQTDLGHLYVALYNIGESDITGACGDLFVEYDITFHNPNHQFRTAKSLIMQDTARTFGSALEHAPLMGATSIGNPGATPSYHGIDNSTAGITTSLLGIGTSPALQNVVANRIHFDEPFHGRLMYSLKQHNGGTVGGVPNTALPTVMNDIVTYTPGKEPESSARYKEVHTLGDTAGITWDWAGVWDVVAKAGDVLDLAFDTAGVISTLNSSELTFTDVAMGLLDVALLA